MTLEAKMSLVDFIERPAIRKAYADFSHKVNLGFDHKDPDSLRVPSGGLHHAAIGTAFDYMLRFRLAREITKHAPLVSLYDMGWIADTSIELFKTNPETSRHYPRWKYLLDKAHELHEEFINGKDVPIERIANCVQYHGAIDLLYRAGRFNSDFKHKEDITKELLALDEIFDPIGMFKPKEICILNPTLIAGNMIGGADADIFIDGQIIDIKTTIKASTDASRIKQLAGYLSLYKIGGIELGDVAPIMLPCNDVGIYFSRHGRLSSWNIQEIFPQDGFTRFQNAFEAEIDIINLENQMPPRL